MKVHFSSFGRSKRNCAVPLYRPYARSTHYNIVGAAVRFGAPAQLLWQKQRNLFWSVSHERDGHVLLWPYSDSAPPYPSELMMTATIFFRTFMFCNRTPNPGFPGDPRWRLRLLSLSMFLIKNLISVPFNQLKRPLWFSSIVDPLVAADNSLLKPLYGR